MFSVNTKDNNIYNVNTLKAMYTCKFYWFKLILFCYRYIYTDKININSIDAACGLCYGAKKYMLNHLVKECIKYLWPNINAKNACQIYEFARMLQENILMEKCLQVTQHTQMKLLMILFMCSGEYTSSELYMEGYSHQLIRN